MPAARSTTRNRLATVATTVGCSMVCALLLASAGCGAFPQSAALPMNQSLPSAGGVVPVANQQPIPSPAAPATEQQVLSLGSLWSEPSNDRDWVPEQRVLAWAERNGDELTVHNVRNAEFFSYRDCLVDYDDRTYNLSKLRSVDFLVVPFNENRALAHTMLSFGFENGEYLGISVEVRLEKGESYNPALGLLGEYEIIYVIADERDLIRVRTEYRKCDVFAYRSTATPKQARELLLDMLQRANDLYDRPEFYDTLSNNCTTNIVRHINRLAPERVPYDYRVLFPGFSDQLAYDLGLIDNRQPFAQLKAAARINDRALQFRDAPDFSARIRELDVVRR